MLLRTLGIVLLCTASFATSAQDLGVGKYSGSYETNLSGQRSYSTAITLNVVSVDDGVVKGTLQRAINTRTPRGCSGDYAMEGKIRDGRIDVRSTEKGGRGGDCTARIRGAVSGDKIVGKFNGQDIELKK